MIGILDFKPSNVLPEEIVEFFAEYWADEINEREENLGEFIQRVAEYALITEARAYMSQYGDIGAVA